ncbi:MAG TPA: ABC transporter permease [Candidatus Thermoplasmatota archaeon]|nr:ABC transporter permease [Candidatus Thermoplasmatota archaeon]
MRRGVKIGLAAIAVADVVLGALLATVWTRGADALAYVVVLTLPIAMIAVLVGLVYVMGGGEGVFRLAWTYNARNWNVVWSYKFRLVSVFAGAVVAISLMIVVGSSVVRYFIAPFELMREAHPDIFQINYLVYLGLGLIAFPLVWMAFTVPAERLRSEQVRGTFEILIPTRRGVSTLPFAYLLYRMVNGLLFAGIMLVLFAYIVPPGQVQVLDPVAVTFAMLALALSALGLWGLGLVFGGLVTIYKEIGPATAVVQFVMMAFSGAYVPVEILPTWAHPIATVLPVTYTFRLLRGALVAEQTVFDLIPELFVVFAFGLVFVVGGMWLYRRCLDSARRHGTIYGY